MLLFFVLLLALAAIAFGVKTMPIEGRLTIPGGQSAAGITVTLNGEQFMTLSRADGSFVFPRVPSGIYSLDVLAIHEVFSQLKIQVNVEEGVVKAVEYMYPGATKRSATYPLQLNALAPLNYFHVRPPLSIMSFIMGNPMMIIMGFSVLMLAYFPKLLKEMDPEALKAYEQAQKETPDPSEMLKKLLG
jgi:hypothetical protein